MCLEGYMKMCGNWHWLLPPDPLLTHRAEPQAQWVAQPCLGQITAPQPLLPSLHMGLRWMQPNLPFTFTCLCFSAFPTTPTLRNILLHLILDFYHGNMLYTNSINRQSWLQRKIISFRFPDPKPRLLIANQLRPVATCLNTYSVHVLLNGLPGGASGKEPGCQRRRSNRQGFPREDPLEEDGATHSSTLPWRIPWTEEPGRLHEITESFRTEATWHTNTCF